MKTRVSCSAASFVLYSASSRISCPALRPSYLYLVTDYDLEHLRDELAKGVIPADFAAKLSRLAAGELSHQVLEQNCRTIIELLFAAQNGSFREITQTEWEHLLRVMAYVRKDDDAIPDYCRQGFQDDQEEVRCAIKELMPLLQTFKAWRLRHQVPALWLKAL